MDRLYAISIALALARSLPWAYFLLAFRGPLAGPWQLFFRGIAAATLLHDLSGVFLTFQFAGASVLDLSRLNPAAVNVSLAGSVVATAAAWLLAVLHWRANRPRRPVPSGSGSGVSS